MNRSLASVLAVLAVLASTVLVHAQQPTSTSIYTASLAGISNCRLVQLTVTRTTDQSSAVRTWLSYTIKDCAPGSQDPTIIVASGNSVIPDSAYTVGRSSEHVVADVNGHVDVTWTVTADVHSTYQASWMNDTRGQTVKSTEASDTRSASVVGNVAGQTIDGRSAYVLTASATSSTK